MHSSLQTAHSVVWSVPEEISTVCHQVSVQCAASPPSGAVTMALLEDQVLTPSLSLAGVCSGKSGIREVTGESTYCKS